MNFKDFFVSGLIITLPVISSFGQKKIGSRPNVLFFVIDDLNDWISVLNKDNPIKMPNLEKLAKEGVLFTHAYCSSPACNPSRSSVLTGTRPHKTGIYGNSSDWRKALPDAVTLQRYFKDNGYFVCGSGKIFHHQQDWAFHDNASFNEYLVMSINEPYPDKKLNRLESLGGRNWDWGAWPANIEKTVDYRTAEYAVQKLHQDFDHPFFLNVGIYKPHSPHFAPQKYFDEYPLMDLKMPLLTKDDCDDLPTGAITLMKDAHWWETMLKSQKINPDAYREFVQAYQSCATFADDMIGKVMKALNSSPYKNNTIIILWSDNGFHLGEKEHIEKFALWEKTTHVPFIIIAPGVTKAGTIISNPVDLTTIYPTLTDLCGLKTPAGIEGFSIVPLLKDQSVKTPPALMTYLKGNHAIRTDRWRFIHYADGSEELYDHSKDENEWYNLANNAKNKELLDSLRIFIPTFNADQVPDLKR